MIIVGIDPSLKATGYGFIEYSNHRSRVLEAGTIEPKVNKHIADRLHVIHSVLGERLEHYKPQVLVLEKLYAHYKHPATASILGHARGVICLLCAQKNIELVEQSVKRIRKSIVGNGSATKIQTRRMVSHMLNIDENKLTLDASDALALSLGYVHLHRHGI
jgi:crossover junction endodeoxyribonuclease RuvC